jgi:predicted methyltransferase
MKHLLLIASLAACGFAGAATTDDALVSALRGSQRSAANVVRDNARHPYETLKFFGIAPTMTVVELVPRGGWYTEILAPYLREHGKLILAASDPTSASEPQRRSAARLQQKLDAQPEVYDKVRMGVFEPPSAFDFAAENSVDMVLSFREVHNWMPLGEANRKALFASVYKALKPGGVFGIEEHRLAADKPQDPAADNGYVQEQVVINFAEGAGFKLAARSEINANPKDHADHKGGVWALPPTFANKDEDKARYAAIGESDRMTLKFVKPYAQAAGK